MKKIVIFAVCTVLVVLALSLSYVAFKRQKDAAQLQMAAKAVFVKTLEHEKEKLERKKESAKTEEELKNIVIEIEELDKEILQRKERLEK
jgi:uncharacterized protein HemX